MLSHFHLPSFTLQSGWLCFVRICNSSILFCNHNFPGKVVLYLNELSAHYQAFFIALPNLVSSPKGFGFMQAGFVDVPLPLIFKTAYLLPSYVDNYLGAYKFLRSVQTSELYKHCSIIFKHKKLP